MLADLHLHSTCSDGILDPPDLAHACHRAGIRAIAVTDHDAWRQNELLAEADLPDDLVWIPGIEISTQHDATGLGFHMLGYSLVPDAPFLESLRRLRDARRERVLGFGEALAAVGITIDAAGIVEASVAPGKPDVARDALARPENRGLLAAAGAHDIGTFIQAYLEEGRPAFVPKLKIATAEAVESIRRCGGHPVLAHPALDLRALPEGDRRRALIHTLDELEEAGLVGVETVNYAHLPGEIDWLEQVAAERGLHQTAGSDFHDFEDRHTNRMLTDCDQDVSWLMV